MNKRALTLCLLFGTATLLIGFQNCAGSHDSASGLTQLQSVGGSQQGLVAFQGGFYAWTKTQGCVKCHGVAQNPQFAIPDVNMAYLNARPLLNVATPGNSIFVTYAGNNHCADPACSDPNVRPHVTDLLTAWANAENAAGQGGTPPPPPVAMAKYFTASTPLPATIPLITVSATTAILRFKLATVKPGVAALNNANALIEVEIQKLNVNEYRITKPKIVGNTAPVTVTGIHIYLRSTTDSGIGQEDYNQGDVWDTLIATAATYTTIPPATTPALAIPLSMMALQASIISNTDVMTIGFDDLK